MLSALKRKMLKDINTGNDFLKGEEYYIFGACLVYGK